VYIKNFVIFVTTLDRIANDELGSRLTDGEETVMEISLIIPAYNEAQRLPATLALYGKALEERYGEQFEMIVVANGCRDTTVEVALAAAVTQPQITVVDIPAAVGKGGAVLEGFRRARGERVLFADADAATTPESLFNLLNHLDRHDVVIGSRHMPTSTITVTQPLQRRIFSRLFAACVWLLFGLSFYDTQCGAKAFRRDAAKRLAELTQETRWAFDVDLLLCAQALAFNVAEQPVVWTDRAGSQLHVGSTIREVVKSLWRMKRRSTQVFVFAHRMQEA
jgi:glycosyltransferase involved in cell wall biosynthesis